MSQVDDAALARPAWRRRTEVDVAEQQLAGIDRFMHALHVLDTAAAEQLSREQQLDRARQEDVVRRERQAVIAQAHHQLEATGEPLGQLAQRRVVIAHRNRWFASRVTQTLEADGVRVACWVDNGADAVGAVVAEQPDVALVEDALAMVPGEHVVEAVREFCASTLVVAQVGYGDRAGALLDAGATAVFTCSVPPADVAQRIVELLSEQRDGT